MFSRSASTLLKASSSASSSSSIIVPLSVRSYTNIRDAGGAFAKKEAAQEEKFAHDHDQELIKKLKEEIAKRPAAPAAPAPAAAEAEPAKPSDPAQARMSPMDSSYGGAVRGGGGALGKKEAAIEEKFFRDLEKEKLEKLKKKK